jgi:hypothetical protein
MAVAINWEYLSYAVKYFIDTGYQYVEVPWIVPNDITRATCPNERYIVNSTLGDIVGSAEQSFLSLDQSGQLGKGRFVACTPCFRNEDFLDDLHQNTFMKVELYRNDIVDRDALYDMFIEVEKFYQICPLWNINKNLTGRACGDGSFDLDLNGIEIGSYGIRSYGEINWIYGTALAEPRFSAALAKKTLDHL